MFRRLLRRPNDRRKSNASKFSHPTGPRNDLYRDMFQMQRKNSAEGGSLVHRVLLVLHDNCNNFDGHELGEHENQSVSSMREPQHVSLHVHRCLLDCRGFAPTGGLYSGLRRGLLGLSPDNFHSVEYLQFREFKCDALGNERREK